MLIGGSVISDSKNVYPASLSIQGDGYVLESKDSNQRATILLYFS